MGNPQGDVCKFILQRSQFNLSEWGNLIMLFMSTQRNIFGHNKNRQDIQEKVAVW